MTTAPALPGRSEAKHRFLKMVQPIDEESLPQPRIAEAGKTYTFPFTFVVPNQLLPGSCAHKTANRHIQSAHLQLPPSLGDAELSGSGGVLLDDMAPEMSKITYAIQVRLTRSKDSNGVETVLADKSRKVQIKPAFEEQPPLSVEQHDEYCLRKEKTIRKGLFKGKLGHIVLEAVQPKSLRLNPPELEPTTSASPAATPVTTMATVRVRFDPANDTIEPPVLGNLSSRIKISTYFASMPRSSLPTRASTLIDMSQGHHSHMAQLSSRCVASAQWERHDPGSRTSYASTVTDSTRRGSEASLAPVPEPSAAYHPGRPFYTTTLLVPITLPANKNFVPTFHSCLVSRLYALDFNLSLHGAGITAPSLSLRVPVQISALGRAGNAGSGAGAAAGVSQEAASEADAVFQPRSVAPPAAEFIGGSAEVAAGARGAPPGYDFFAPARGVPVCG